MESRIRDYPIPEGLSIVQKAEYIAFQEAMTDIEEDWIKLKEGQNSDQLHCEELIEKMKNDRYAQALERRNIRLNIIMHEYEDENVHINQEQEEYKQLLFERLMRAYHQAYKSLTDRLKPQLGNDYQSFIQANPIDFPSIPQEPPIKTRMQRIEDVKPKLSQAEIDDDLNIMISQTQ